MTAALTGAACDWPWRHDMADQPSRPAAAGPRLPASGTVPIDGSLPLAPDVSERLLRNPIPRDAPVDRGGALYSVYCAPCHGQSGRGDGPVAREFAPAMGDLRSPDVQRHGDGWLYAVIANGTGHMPPSAHELDVIERWQIVNFLRTFGGRSP
jgi:mono/diheme cytochrome c family protein